MGDRKRENHCRKENCDKIIVRMVPLLSKLENLNKMSPTFSSFDPRGFRRGIDFREKGKWPCRNLWERDLSKHVRNKAIRDLPFLKPKCCRDIFNQMRDKKNAKKLRTYNLDKEIRPFVRGMEVRQEVPCKTEDVPIVEVPECYTVEWDSDSSDEDTSLVDRSDSDCSGCSTLGEGLKRPVRKPAVSYREILHRPPSSDPCDKYSKKVKKLL